MRNWRSIFSWKMSYGVHEGEIWHYAGPSSGDLDDLALDVDILYVGTFEDCKIKNLRSNHANTKTLQPTSVIVVFFVCDMPDYTDPYTYFDSLDHFLKVYTRSSN